LKNSAFLDFSVTVMLCLIMWFLSGARRRTHVLSPEEKSLC